jgi:hypothetical protein
MKVYTMPPHIATLLVGLMLLRAADVLTLRIHLEAAR